MIDWEPIARLLEIMRAAQKDLPPADPSLLHPSQIKYVWPEDDGTERRKAQ